MTSPQFYYIAIFTNFVNLFDYTNKNKFKFKLITYIIANLYFRENDRLRCYKIELFVMSHLIV